MNEILSIHKTYEFLDGKVNSESDFNEKIFEKIKY